MVRSIEMHKKYIQVSLAFNIRSYLFLSTYYIIITCKLQCKETENKDTSSIL